MKYCTKCGTRAEDYMIYCSNCGAMLPDAAKTVPRNEEVTYQKELHSDIDVSKEPTQKNIHGMAGPVWLLILATYFLGFGFAVPCIILSDAPGSFESHILVCATFLLIGSGALAGGLLLLIKFARSNKRVKERLLSQQCETVCRRCGRNIRYNGTDPIRHKKWKYGYIVCPYCHSVNGHYLDNIKSVK